VFSESPTLLFSNFDTWTYVRGTLFYRLKEKRPELSEFPPFSERTTKGPYNPLFKGILLDDPMEGLLECDKDELVVLKLFYSGKKNDVIENDRTISEKKFEENIEKYIAIEK
jgi:hypothetical protein